MYDPELEEFTKIKTIKGDLNTVRIQGLKREKTYSFKIRAYVRSGSKNNFGDPSKVCKVKTKK